MGLFDFIFIKPKKIENNFFGQMNFIESKKDSSKNYFECHRFFKPKNDIIEIGISGDLTGPTQKQIDFFSSVENNYIEIITSIIPIIEDEVRNWKEDFTINNFEQEFKPVYLTIPNCASMPISWELSFETEHDRNHLFTVTMENYIGKSLFIDG